MDSSIQYYCIDTETNGLIAKNLFHEVLQISIIRCKDKVQLTKYIKCEKPENSSLDALRITGKTIADIVQGISKEGAVETCNKFFNEDGLTPNHRCIIGHNIISFDKRFLHELWSQTNSIFPANLWLDTMQMFKHYMKTNGFPKNRKSNLDFACQTMNIKKQGITHSAKGDSQNTYLLWKKINGKQF